MTAPSLHELYHVASKHSNYQVLPSALLTLLHQDELSVKSRNEAARLDYIVSKLPVAGLRVADIGGNTGFFSFELLGRGAATMDYFEGNAAHHDFVTAAATQLGYGERLRTHNEYVAFEPGVLPQMDVTLLLNVLHHVGDDFGDATLGRDEAKRQMLTCLAALAQSTTHLVFQLGFNWKGNRDLPLFASGSKQEMIEFVTGGTAHDWTVDAIGVAERRDSGIAFHDLDGTNIARNDSLGEFLNRPIFIMQSRHLAAGQGLAQPAFISEITHS